MDKKERAEALLRMGESYISGDKGAKKDYAAAIKVWKEAAELGNVDAQYNLGVCYNNGTGVKADNAEAARWRL